MFRKQARIHQDKTSVYLHIQDKRGNRSNSQLPTETIHSLLNCSLNISKRRTSVAQTLNCSAHKFHTYFFIDITHLQTATHRQITTPRTQNTLRSSLLPLFGLNKASKLPFVKHSSMHVFNFFRKHGKQCLSTADGLDTRHDQ